MLLTKRWLGDSAVKRSAAAPEHTIPKADSLEVEAKAPKKRSVPETEASKKEKIRVEPSRDDTNPPDQSSKPKRPKRAKLAEQNDEGVSAQQSEKPAKRKKPKKERQGEATDQNEPTKSEEAVGQAAKLQEKNNRLNKAKRHRNRRRKKKVGVVKEPEAAAAYLSSWAAQQAGEDDAWRFNKATQAWIIRHAYETNKVEAASFKLLLKYIDGLRGAARDRMMEDANAVVAQGGVPPPKKEESQLSKRARLNAERRAANQAARQAEIEQKKADKAAARGKPPPKSAAEETDAAPEPSAEQAEAPKKEETPEEVEVRQTRLRRAEKVLKRLGASPAADEQPRSCDPSSA